MTPQVSILMGIYNCASTLGESIESIQGQTFRDWEFILCDDGSSDETYAVAARYAAQDGRIVLIRNPKNIGLAATLNYCLTHAKGVYVARMDGDDRSKPERLAREVAWLAAHPQYDVVSTGMAFFDEAGPWGTLVPPKEFPQPMDFARGTQFCHAPSMSRRAAVAAVGGYDPSAFRVEDYDLWVRMYAKGSRGGNILEPLYEVRDGRGAVARRTYKNRWHEAKTGWLACRLLRLPWRKYPWVLRPLLVGLLPQGLYGVLRRRFRGMKR